MVCVCVREIEIEREGKKEGERERESEKRGKRERESEKVRERERKIGRKGGGGVCCRGRDR